MPIVIASSFADAADILAYRRARSHGYSEQEALRFGDNGIGLWGDPTYDTHRLSCALPFEDWFQKWGTGRARGKQVEVTYKGISIIGELRDTMPHRKNIHNGAGIDLNPAFSHAFGLSPPFLLPGFQWEWVQ